MMTMMKFACQSARWMRMMQPCAQTHRSGRGRSFILKRTYTYAPHSSQTATQCAVTPTDVGPNIVEQALRAGNFQTLAKALATTDLLQTLQGAGPFTVFAPTDAAFEQLPEEVRNTLFDDPNRLKRILLHHVASGSLDAEVLAHQGGATTLSGQHLTFEDGAVAGADIAQADIGCSNGLIHAVNAVLLPSEQTIAEMAVKTPRFSTLLTALQTAGLDSVLAGEGPFTVLAPNDAAFAKIPEETLKSLLEVENRDRLVTLLKGHVVKGRLFSNQVVQQTTVHTLSGSKIKPRIKNGRVYLGEAALVADNIQAANGVIHEIDTVLQ